MRFVIFAAALLFLSAPAHAQTKPEPPQAVDVAPERVAAARQTLSVMMIDNGLLNELVLEAFRTHLPSYQRNITGAPFVSQLTPARRSAVESYVNNLGPVLSEEVLRMSPALLDTFAPRIGALFNEAELADIRAYLQSPAGASLFRRAALAGARGETAPIQYTPEELAGEAAFLTTAGGRAWQAQVTPFNALLHDLGYQSVAQTAPNFQARVIREICVLAEEQCPPEMRAGQPA